MATVLIRCFSAALSPKIKNTAKLRAPHKHKAEGKRFMHVFADSSVMDYTFQASRAAVSALSFLLPFLLGREWDNFKSDATQRTEGKICVSMCMLKPPVFLLFLLD